jgi:hypothetical protein
MLEKNLKLLPFCCAFRPLSRPLTLRLGNLEIKERSYAHAHCCVLAIKHMKEAAEHNFEICNPKRKSSSLFFGVQTGRDLLIIEARS